MFPPGPKFEHQAGEVEALGLCPESLQFRAAFLQERAEPCRVAPSVVMKGCSHLDETVHESLPMALSFQPHGFECLVGFKKFPRVEQADSLHDAVFHRHLGL